MLTPSLKPKALPMTVEIDVCIVSFVYESLFFTFVCLFIHPSTRSSAIHSSVIHLFLGLLV